MTAESFSAEPETPEAGEPLVTTPAHWGTAQLGAPPPPPVRPAAWPQAANVGTVGAPTDQAPRHTPDPGIGITHEGAVPALPAEPPAVPPFEAAAPAETQAHAQAQGDVEAEGNTEGGAEAVERLLRIAVESRPLDDIADLVTRLEQTPDGTPTAASILRLAAVTRPVDDVTRLVELLGPPEHPEDHMDEAIRHAAQQRPVPEVTRLIRLLSRSSHDPRTGSEAVHAAATSRSVEDLMQLIGSLDERRGGAPVVMSTAPVPETPPAPNPAPAGPASAESGTTAEGARPRKRPDSATPQTWMRRAAGVLMLLCAAAHLPMDWSQGSAFGVSAALGVSAVCAAAGIALFVSGSLSVAVAGTLVAGALAVGHLLDGRLGSDTLSRVLRPEGVPAPLPTLLAVVATFAALLVVAMTVSGLRTSSAQAPDPQV
ncbi:hypothetical protein ACIRF8_35050 [Streptomyces sp. NPDC102406]|uniref:hypothetical protein n=1 Tax=Streptomyces sp. NPDC102406 TaxID=3366171 RepID=UPI0038056D6F